MSSLNPRRALLIAVPALAFACLSTLLPACGKQQDTSIIRNQAPHLVITGGPDNGTTAPYQTRIFWTGWDDDGVIDHYEIAVDPPPEFTQAEITRPEAAPGVTVETLSGRGFPAPVVRVSKVVNNRVVTFDYEHTPYTDRLFTLPTPDIDSVAVGTRLEPDITSSGTHEIYVRAMDNEGAYSNVDRIGFTAKSFAPSAFITFPFLRGEAVLFTGLNTIVEWFGIDPDPPTPNSLPAGFYYKLIRLRNLTPPQSVFRPLDLRTVVYDLAAHIPWTYQSAETLGTQMFVSPGEYLFVVRAVDKSGAEEVFLDWDRGQNPGNAMRFVASNNGGFPTLVLNESKLGSFLYRGDRQVLRVEAPVHSPLFFSWTASAEDYGGRIESYSWGLDVEDLDVEGPGSGWSPWGATVSTGAPLVFDRPGTHVLYVRARDRNGIITLATLILRVFDTPLNREVLLVDDYLNTSFPLDREHDAFWLDLFRNSGRLDAGDLNLDEMWFEAGGDGDRFYIDDKPPTLSLLGQFKLVIWLNQGAGWCGDTSLLKAGVLTPLLQTYLGLGGKLWVTGSQTLAATKRGIDCNDPSMPFHNPNLPITPAALTQYPHEYEPGDFAWDVLKLYTLDVRNDQKTDWENTLVAVKPFDPANPVFDEMWVDPDKFAPQFWENNALPFVDAVFGPMFGTEDPSHTGKLDSLYAYVAANEVRPLRGSDLQHSPYSGRLCATRWHDPDPARTQGRVMWFGFPLYYMENNAAQETFNRAFDWFAEEEVIPPAKPR